MASPSTLLPIYEYTAGAHRAVAANGAYAGVAQWDGLEAAGIYPAIISKDVYEQAHRPYRHSGRACRRNGR
jgi:hypothetical protein